MLDHKLHQGRDLVLDDIQPGVRPEDAGREADGEVDGVHAVDLFVDGDVVEQGHQVLEEDLVLYRQPTQAPGVGERKEVIIFPTCTCMLLHTWDLPL